MTDPLKALEVAYNRECAIIGNAYSIITEQKALLKGATARRSQIALQYEVEQKKLSEAADTAKTDESHNDRK